MVGTSNKSVSEMAIEIIVSQMLEPWLTLFLFSSQHIQSIPKP
jgi:hypothetical protein